MSGTSATGLTTVELLAVCDHLRSIRDPATTERICSDCGTVLSPPEIVSLTEYRAGEDGQPLRHHETSLRHRMGTLVPLTARTRSLRRHQSRSNREAMGGRKDHWYRELNRMAKRLETPRPVLEAAEHRLGGMIEQNQTAGYSTEAIAAALIWLFQRELGCPEPMAQFRNRAGIPRKMFNHAVGLCKRTLKIGLVPVTPRTYLERIRPDMEPKVMRLAERVLNAWADDPQPQPVVTPAVLAASSVYLVGRCLDFPGRSRRSQRNISEKFSCTEVSCRTGVRALLDSQPVEQLLHAEGFDLIRIFD